MFQELSWPDYLKEISRRSRAGFGSVHAELLQRYGAPVAKEVSLRHTSSKELVRQNRMTSRFFGKSKSKDRKDSAKETFVSYVEGDEDDTEQQGDPSVNPVLSGSGGDAVDTVSVDSSANSTEGNRNQKNGVNLNRPTVNIIANVGKKSEYKNAGTLSYTGRLNNNVSEEPVYQVPLSDHPIYEVPPSEEPIYQVPRGTDCEHANFKIQLGTDSVCGENDNADSLPDYSNIGEFTESSHLDIFGLPISSDILQETKNDNITLTKAGHEEKGVNRIISRTFDSDNDYVDMQGLPHRDKRLSCSAVEDKLRRSFENISNFREKLQPQVSRSAPSSPSLCASRNQLSESGTSSYVRDDVNEYVGPDPIEIKTVKTPKSATVAPYIHETDLSRRTLSRNATRSFVQYTVEEVVDCFEVCALPKVARVCKEESLDGEYFKDLSDENLAQEPFCLTDFHICKVRRIVAGWRPKRMTSYS